MSDWKRQLQTPQGQLQLMAATLIGAALFAGFLTTQDAYFRGYIREKPVETTAATQRLVKDIGAGAAPTLTDKDQEAIYDALITSTSPVQPNVLEALSTGEPPWLCARAERTLIGGTPAQALRALSLVKDHRNPWCQRMLSDVHQRVDRMGPDALKAPLRAATGG